MRVGDADSFVAFEFKEILSDRLPGGADVACSVTASCNGFHGRVERVWFSRENIDRFLSELQGLDERRKGSAALMNLSSGSDYNPLRFEIFPVDEAGHLAVKADLSKASYIGGSLSPLRASVTFPLDAGEMASILVGFRLLFAGKRNRS
jgi:hypothetical protein